MVRNGGRGSNNLGTEGRRRTVDRRESLTVLTRERGSLYVRRLVVLCLLLRADSEAVGAPTSDPSKSVLVDGGVRADGGGARGVMGVSREP